MSAGTDPDITLAGMKRKAWDEALMLTMMEHSETGIGGEKLLAAVIEEANDAMARLKERGELIGADEEEA